MPTGHWRSDLAKLLLLIECLVLLAPAFVAISILTFGAIVIFPAYFLGTAFGLSWNLPTEALLMPIWLLPLCIASWIALWEVVMVASATLGGRIYSFDNRTRIAAALGMAAILGAWLTTFLDQTDRSFFGILSSSSMALGCGGPVLFLCGHLWWLQVRLRRSAAAA